ALVMRKFALTLALIGLLALPVYAQFGLGGGTATLLLNKGVQDELKLTEAQKTDLGKIQDKVTAAGKEAREAFMDGDFEKGREIMGKANEVAGKSLVKFKEKLNTTQAKRLKQIELQVDLRLTGLKAFTNEDIAKGVKLTEKQKESLADAVK